MVSGSTSADAPAVKLGRASGGLGARFNTRRGRLADTCGNIGGGTGDVTPGDMGSSDGNGESCVGASGGSVVTSVDATCELGEAERGSADDVCTVGSAGDGPHVGEDK